MQKKIFLIILPVVFCGCANTGQEQNDFMADLGTFITALAEAVEGANNNNHIAHQPNINQGMIFVGGSNQQQINVNANNYPCPLFDSHGRTKYFLYQNGRVVGRDGRNVAWIDSEGNVYNYQGRHLAWFKDGHMRGHDGGVLTWQQDAQNLGVIRPILQVSPIPPIPNIESIRPVPSIPPIPPVPTLNWSNNKLE